MQVPKALISLGFVAVFGAAPAWAQSLSFDGPVMTGPAAAPASTGPAARVHNPAPFPQAPIRPEAPTEAVTTAALSDADQTTAPSRTIEISPTLSLGSRRVYEEKAAGGLLRSNPGLQRANRKSFGFGMKF